MLHNCLYRVNADVLVTGYLTAKFAFYVCLGGVKYALRLKYRNVKFQGRNLNVCILYWIVVLGSDLNFVWRIYVLFCFGCHVLLKFCFYIKFVSRITKWVLWSNLMYLTPFYFPSGRYCGYFFIFFSPKICCLAEAIVCFYFCIFPS